MIGMIGVIILVAREIIPMTRMMAQIYKNTREIKKTHPRGGREAAAPLGARPKAAPVFSLFSLVFLKYFVD